MSRVTVKPQYANVYNGINRWWLIAQVSKCIDNELITKYHDCFLQW